MIDLGKLSVGIKVTKMISGRMKKIKGFKVIDYLGEPDSSFIPVKEEQRAKLYKEFADDGIILPKYSSFKRRALRKRDMRVLKQDWFIKFIYDGHAYRIDYKKGFCWDGASVPVVFRMGNTTAHNSYVSIAAMVHDVLFATKTMPFEDANNIFSGLLRDKKLNKFALGRYMLGVRSPVGRLLYKKSNPATTWMRDWVKMRRIDE